MARAKCLKGTGEENKVEETIRITMIAVQTISAESLRCPEVETGGRLIGYPRARVISHATEPGPRAVKEPCRFSDDVEFWHEHLAAIQRLGPRWLAGRIRATLTSLHIS